ncbi:terminase [Arthrobacter sp. AQ5-05]|uniref:terminase n=1 Tax=Arthrobacter sp. AQ5-05 TaxID=2184581 RepID=UPI000DCEF1D2|nr:terminase [Arthrobacter sp. AQ5-05]RAX48943.1 terminase [Arthrobacter sp. AQ5-05]
MTNNSAPDHGAAPQHLGEAGARLYASAVADYELTIPETAALLQAAETVDTLRILEDSIRANGPITPTGRPNPLLAEARQQRAILVRLLGLLDLRLDEEDDTASPKRPSASRQAQKAARAMHDKRRGR